MSIFGDKHERVASAAFFAVYKYRRNLITPDYEGRGKLGEIGIGLRSYFYEVSSGNGMEPGHCAYGFTVVSALVSDNVISLPKRRGEDDEICNALTTLFTGPRHSDRDWRSKVAEARIWRYISDIQHCMSEAQSVAGFFKLMDELGYELEGGM